MDAGTQRGARSAGPTPGPAPSAAVRLGPYRLLHVIGGGGMGVVHLALDPAGRAVAVKVLRPHVAADPTARARLAREVDTLRRVRSVHVAEVLDADPDADQPYLVTQFVPAPPLDAHVEALGPLADADLARLGLGLGDALAAIHAAGVVHRDLKPGNVLLQDGDPVVIDFGIAQIADDVRLTSAGLVMGTPGYLSPEVLDGGAVGASTDWWGWAATTAYAATGRPPFGTGPTEAVLSRVRRGVPDLDGAPAGLVDVLAAALSPDPADRPPPRRLREAVQALVPGALPRDQAVRAHPAPPAPRPTAALPRATTPLERRAAPPDGRTTALPEAVAPLAATTPLLGPVAPQADDTALVPALGGGDLGGGDLGGRDLGGGDLGGGTLGGGDAHGRDREAHGASAVPAAPAPGPAWPSRRSGTLAAALAALVASAAVVPLVAVLVGVGAVLLARTTDRSAAAVVRRRYERGPRRSDAALTVLGVPGHLLAAAVASLPALVLPALMAVSAAFLVGWAVRPGAPVPGQSLSLAAGALSGALTAWWGPGGGPVRRGGRLVVRALAPAPRGAVVAVVLLVLLAVAAALVVLAGGAQPDWTPLARQPLG